MNSLEWYNIAHDICDSCTLIIIRKNCVTTKRKLPVLKPEQLAKDLELFTHHAGRKSANMEDVILCGELFKPYRF